MRSMAARGQRLRYLNLNGQDDLSDRQLAGLLGQLPNLQTLRAQGTNIGGFTLMLMGNSSLLANMLTGSASRGAASNRVWPIAAASGTGGLPTASGRNVLSPVSGTASLCSSMTALDLSNCKQLQVSSRKRLKHKTPLHVSSCTTAHNQYAGCSQCIILHARLTVFV